MIKYNQVDKKTFTDSLGSRELDKKIMCFVIADTMKHKTARTLFPFNGEISSINITVSLPSSQDGTQFNIRRIRQITVDSEIDNIINKESLLINAGTTLIKYEDMNSILNLEDIQVLKNDIFYIDIIQESSVRPGFINIEIEVQI